MAESVVTAIDENFEVLARNIQSGALTIVHMDLRNVTWMSSLELTLWRCFIDLCTKNSVTLTIQPPIETDVAGFAGRMGLFDGTAFKYSKKKQTSDSFFSLYQIQNDSNNFLFDELNRVFGPEQPSVNWAGDVAAALTELADNVFYHSGNTFNVGWGYAHTQKTHGNKIVHVGIADLGVGYYSSYERTGQVRGRDTQQIVTDSFKLQESSLNLPGKPPHRGLGLSYAVDFLTGYSGTMQLTTDDIRVSLSTDGQLNTTKLKYKICGTRIFMEFPIV